MLVENLLDVVEQSGHIARNEILEEIQQNSKTLAAELRRFIDLCAGFKIYSFYETDQTRQVVVVRSSRETPEAPHGLTLFTRAEMDGGGEMERLQQRSKTGRRCFNSLKR